MNSLVLSSPDFFDRTFADLFDQLPVRVVIPNSGIQAESVPGSPQHRIYTLHQTILANQQKAWFQPLSSKHKVSDFGEYEDELDSILDTMGADWLVQDALLNHFLPLWLSRADNPVLFLYFSEPLECAYTLQQKWRFPMSFGLALWESYMLSAVNSLIGLPCISVSSSELRQSPQKVMNSVFKQIRNINQEDGIPVTGDGSNWPTLSTKPPVDLSSYSEFLQDSQKEIFTHLENGEIKRLEGRAPDPQSADILDYYGQLRAGFEMLKKKQNHCKGRADLNYSAANPSVTEPVETGSTPVAAYSLCDVTVHIRGMKPVEFIVEADSPVLQMLWHSLQLTSQMPDEMVYLDYEDKATSALYFMRSSLLGIETTPSPH